jgi:hypothetical protein
MDRRSGGYWDEISSQETRETGFLLARLDQLWLRVPGYKPLSVGIVLLAGRHQPDLFVADNHRRQKLSPLVDRINDPPSAFRSGQCRNFARSWNLAPTDPAPVVYYDAKDGSRRLEIMRWGLIPYWAKDEVDTKPAFREAFQRRRCPVPLDSFYKWKKTASGKQPYAIALKDRRLMGMAAPGSVPSRTRYPAHAVLYKYLTRPVGSGFCAGPKPDPQASP